MIARVILLIAFGAFLICPVARADDGAKLPSRKASVVMPLLRQISQSDSPQSVFEKVSKILGKPDAGDVSGGPQNRFTSGDLYFLDDKTQISVSFLNGRFSGITSRAPGQVWVTLYQAPKS